MTTTTGETDADPRPRDVLAAEYVLGTLEAREAQAVAGALDADPDLAGLVATWERRLAPLSGLAPSAPPPPGLWERIETSLDALAPPLPVAMPGPRRDGPAAAPSAAPPMPPRRDRAPRRRAPVWALGATALAAGVAGLLLARPLAEAGFEVGLPGGFLPGSAGAGPRLSTALLPAEGQPAWVVEADRGGIRLASLNTRPPEGDRVLQLWALPEGAGAPTSLGLVPASGLIAVSPAGLIPEVGMLIEITLEPPGGSPTGRPTGPVQFIGRLRPVAGA